MSASRAADLADLTGRTILVTGSSSGIGRAAALRLAEAGATVLVHGRSPDKTAAVARTVGTEPLIADFTRLSEVSELADLVLDRAGRLDAVLHNAGAYSKRRTLTSDGFESTFQTDYLAPFLLQLLLNDRLMETPGSRVVVTTSIASHLGRVDLDDLDGSRRKYRGSLAYASTKLLQILWVDELRRRFAGSSSTAVAVHPGAVGTRFGAGSLLPSFLYRIPVRKKFLLGFFVNTPEQGAEPLVWLIAAAERPDVDAPYFYRFGSGRSPAKAEDARLAREVWERSLEMVEEWVPGEVGLRCLLSP